MFAILTFGNNFYMKKTIYIFLIFILLLSTCYFAKKDLFFTYFSRFDGEFCYAVKGENKSLPNNSVKCGAYNFVYFDKNNGSLDADYKKVKLKDITLFEKILDDLDIEILFEENEKYHIFYGFSQKFADFRIYKTRKINFQIVICDFLLIGYPMVYMGF